MNLEQKMVLRFHQTFGILVNKKPTIIPDEIVKLREDLILEELDELVVNSLFNPDLTDIADALGDLLYVVYGTAVSFGIDMEPIFKEIHRDRCKEHGRCCW
ncbi:hypothetical protein LCGC14_3151960 [marine sediment metagenome]|uniref:NTP pyrophosphohydrolase MazG putative catalytic core domain-containing protein n=1 Tax=marine sediment metagenome TaxID=412755 RepID=A0A0F8VTR9_9ZZZZ